MEQIQKILDKAPKSVQDKFLIKKRERAIEIVKEKIEKSEKSLDDFDKNFIEPIRTELIASSTKKGMGKEEAIAEADLNNWLLVLIYK